MTEKRVRIFVMGDIHGAFKALVQCLERCGFDYNNDILIQLGDVVDGIGESYECVEELLRINNLIAIKGNHDEWFHEFIETDYHPVLWNHGGNATILSYLRNINPKGKCIRSGNGYKTSLNAADIPQKHRQFFQKQLLYYIDDEQRCFVHAGFDRQRDFIGQEETKYYFDRSLWTEALKAAEQPEKNNHYEIVTTFRDIYIGHTSTTKWNTDHPMTAFHITNMDTGAGHDGRLTILDTHTKEFWQSDPIESFYGIKRF